MEKFLLASTALVASTTFAFAEVNVSGTAEMGVFGASTDLFEDVDDSDADLQFHTDIDVTFTMAGETDSGLTFGASIDLDESDGDPSPAFDADTQGGETIFVDGAYGRLTMGDTDGALDWAMEEAIIGGSIQDDHEHAGYSGNDGLDGTYDGQIARYEYAFGDFAVAASAEIEDDDTGNGGDPVLGVGARYNGEFAGVSFGAGLGYQSFSDIADDNADIDGEVDADGRAVGLSLSAKMNNGLQAIFNYSTYDFDFTDSFGEFAVDEELNVDHYGIALGYEFGAFLVAANYGRYNAEAGDFDGNIDGYGLVVNYDLGGGAQLQAGYGHSDLRDLVDLDDEDAGEVDTYSFGIAMSF